MADGRELGPDAQPSPGKYGGGHGEGDGEERDNVSENRVGQ